MRAMIEIENVAKAFTLHLQGGTAIPVLQGVSLRVMTGECVALAGPSGAGKSTLLRMIYGNYRCPQGAIRLRRGDGTIDIAAASPQDILALRRTTIGYVSQYLRVIPRVPALDIVAEPLRARGVAPAEAERRAGKMLTRLNLPERLWRLPPATFSGGEQQRINVARGLVAGYPILLLDEPTASLDAGNRQAVVSLIDEARRAGSAILAIFHDEELRRTAATRVLDFTPLPAAA